jgi:hypothetical protein
MALWYVQTALQHKLQVSNSGTRWVFDDATFPTSESFRFGLVSLVVPALAVLLWFWFFFWECGVLFRFASAQPSTPPGTPVLAASSKRS